MARPKDPDLRNRLLDAAAAVFGTRGFKSTSMSDVGRAAGVTKGGVYFHFRSKEELFFAAVDRWRGGLQAVLARVPPAGQSGAAMLREVVRDYLAFHFDRPAAAALMRVLATELGDRFTATLRGDVRDEHRALRTCLRAAVAAGNRDGTCFAGDPAFAAFAIAGAVLGLLEQWLTAPTDVEPFCDPEALAEAVVGSYVTGAQASPRDVGNTEDAAGRDFRPPV